jgi:hypothetical protein
VSVTLAVVKACRCYPPGGTVGVGRATTHLGSYAHSHQLFVIVPNQLG